MQKDDCIFCKIAKGEVPARTILEDDKHMAFLSHAPNTEGFSVVITKEHYDSYFAEVEEKVREGIVNFASKTAKLLDNTFEDVGRTGLFFEGFGVDHLHAKLFPMHGTKGGKWEAHNSDVKKYFEKYEGYISSHNYGEPGRAEIDETWEKFKK
jgi:histidine triad (HIT) family protein